MCSMKYCIGMELYLQRQLLIAGCLYVGSIVTGLAAGWTAPLLPILQDPEQTPLDRPATVTQSSYVGSLILLGTIFGPYTIGLLANIKGRKPCLIVAAAVTMVAFIVLALANNIAMVYAGRIMVGLGVGTILIVKMVYIGEITSTKLRGILLTVSGIFYAFGILIIYSIGPYLPYRVTNYISISFALIYLIALFFIPESPVFNVLEGQDDKAIQTLIYLGRKEDIDKIIKSKEGLPQTNVRSKEWLEIFTNRINRRTLFIAVILHILQQTCGVPVVIYFATAIFEMAGSSVDPNIATIIIGVAQIFASCVSPFFVEKAGRKSLIVFSTALATISMAILGMYFHFDINGNPVAEKIQWLPLVALIVFLISYVIGLGIIPGTLVAEMFLPNVRSTGSIFIATLCWFVSFWVVTLFNSMLDILGSDVTFWIFSGSCASAFLFSLFFVPETKGKSLFDIHEMLEQKSFFYLKFK